VGTLPPLPDNPQVNRLNENGGSKNQSDVSKSQKIHPSIGITLGLNGLVFLSVLPSFPFMYSFTSPGLKPFNPLNIGLLN